MGLGSESLKSGASVGILGGGQLARMLAEAALRLGLAPIVFAENAAEPAAQLCPSAVFGKLDDEIALRRFFLQLARTSEEPVVAFENEFVDAPKLERIAARTGARFVPSLAAITTLQDKLSQKESLKKLGIPTSPWVELSTEADLAGAVKVLGPELVLKWAKFGYDGKGTHFFRGDGNAAAEFMRGARSRVYAEKAIRFRRELAVVGVRSVTGEFAAYPLVITEQPGGTCLKVLGPATAFGAPQALEAKAWAHTKRFGEAHALAGAFAIEFFEEEGSGELLVNEIAPRVHNSGHFTQDCADASQFENHWRALLGLPLGSTKAAPAFAMLNLLGPKGASVAAAKAPLPRPGRDSRLHWYGKGEIRPARKLGHLNGRADTPDGLANVVSEMESIEAEWARGALEATEAVSASKKGGTGK